MINGTGSRSSACSFIKMLFFCRDMLYRLHKQYDHVIMLSKDQSAQNLSQIPKIFKGLPTGLQNS